MFDPKDFITIIDHNVPNAEQPELIKIQLKEHQLKMLYKCLELERNSIKINNTIIQTSLGVIGDPVGSGKSYIILSLIASKFIPSHQLIIKSRSSLLNVYEPRQITNNINCDLLVIPYNLITQWKSYISNTGLNVLYLSRAKDLKDIKYEDYNLIVVSSSIYNKFYYLPKNGIRFNRVIFDEADSIKIPSCEKIQGYFYWFVTSSINNLLIPAPRSHHDLPIHIAGIKHNGFIKNTFMELGYLYNYKKYVFLQNDNNLIKESFLLPEPTIMKILCKNLTILNVLSGCINENIKRMIFAGNIEDAIKEIDIQKTNETNIIKIIANDILREIENKKIDLESIKRKTYTNPKKQEEDISKIEKEINTLNNKVNDISNRLKENNIDPITYEEIKNLVIINCCQQNFDFESITKYIASVKNAKCPMCRTPITNNNLILVHNEEEEETKEEEEKVDDIFDKPIELNNILTKKLSSNSRILIFSEFSNTWNAIAEILEKNNIIYKELKGNQYVINNILKWYRDGEDVSKVLLLNAKFYGSGLNLENTSDVIIYHKMDDDLEKQVIGRAQRVGRKTSLNIWRLLYENEN
jgi:hypothetical protein